MQKTLFIASDSCTRSKALSDMRRNSFTVVYDSTIITQMSAHYSRLPPSFLSNRVLQGLGTSLFLQTKSSILAKLNYGNQEINKRSCHVVNSGSGVTQWPIGPPRGVKYDQVGNLQDSQFSELGGVIASAQ